jgi:uncharacterized membrane protein (DUF485 family)
MRATMDIEKARGYGALSGAFLMIAAFGAYWLNTPHPDASGTREAAAVMQVIVSAVLAIIFWHRGGRGAPASSDR